LTSTRFSDPIMYVYQTRVCVTTDSSGLL